MDRPSCVLLFGLLLLLGCGQSKAPSPAPAPAFKPDDTAAPPAQAEANGEQPAAANDENVAEEMPAVEQEKMAIDAPAEASPEESAETPPADEPAAGPTKVEEADETTAANEEAAPTGSGKAKKSGGKLFRGLGSSLTRALAKLPAADVPAEKHREPPALADDPYPEGEPSDKKANE